MNALERDYLTLALIGVGASIGAYILLRRTTQKVTDKVADAIAAPIIAIGNIGAAQAMGTVRLPTGEQVLVDSIIKAGGVIRNNRFIWKGREYFITGRDTDGTIVVGEVIG